MNGTHANVPAAIPPAGSYRIDPERSTITIATRHLFGLGRVRATLALRDGRIQVTDPPDGAAVRASAAAVSFRSGNDTRDAAVLSPRLLDAATYPSIVFTSAALENRDGQWLLRGELEVRGTGRPVEAVIVAEPAHGGTLHASARLRVDRYAFGITAYRGLAARWLTVDLDIIAECDKP
jgi:polyisoprenoid-binding protein YceI